MSKTILTLTELCENYGITESQISKNFPRMKKKLEQERKIEVIKKGIGKKAVYEVIDHRKKEEVRELTMFLETKEKIFVNQDEFSDLQKWEFVVFVALSLTPYYCFGGTYKEFLHYVGMPHTSAKAQKLKQVFADMQDKEYLTYALDKTDPKHSFIISLTMKVRKDLVVPSYMISRCKKLAEKYGKKSWVNLLKTWVGMKMMEGRKHFTIEDFSALTGLTPYQIRESKRLLEHEDIFVTSRVYIDFCTCLGQEVDLNKLHND